MKGGGHRIEMAFQDFYFVKVVKNGLSLLLSNQFTNSLKTF